MTKTEKILMVIAAGFILALYIATAGTANVIAGGQALFEEPAAEDTSAPGALWVVLQERIDLNSATAEDLESLPGVGKVLAERIVDYREANGPFSSLEDLLDVPGLGESVLDRIYDASEGGSAGPAG